LCVDDVVMMMMMRRGGCHCDGDCDSRRHCSLLLLLLLTSTSQLTSALNLGRYIYLFTYYLCSCLLVCLSRSSLKRQTA